MELKDLAGEHVLDFVPKMDLRHPIGGDASGVIFGLSGKCYIVFEDEDDGYRSHAGPILSFEGSAYQIGGEWYPEYLNEPVLCMHITKGSHGNEDDILSVVSKATGKEVFRIGTSNIDDYYPGFEMSWHPENLAANSRP